MNDLGQEMGCFSEEFSSNGGDCKSQGRISGCCST
jgi:hypothetical protein